MGRPDYDVIIIGGGFFGCSLAVHLRQTFKKVLLVERGPELMERASYVNQARVHNGYHYPRSFLTATRSHVNFPRFVRDYERCVVSDFDKVYAVGRQHSKVTAAQFKIYFDRIGAPLYQAPERIRKLFNYDLIDDIYMVKEYAFDPAILRQMAWEDLQESRVEVRLNTSADKIKQLEDEQLELDIVNADSSDESLKATYVFNVTYAGINRLLVNSELPMIPLKQELTEMALVEQPDELKNLGITVMCGPFFSTMPFPPEGIHTLSHVRYTPHCYWLDDPEKPYRNAYDYFEEYPKKSDFIKMRNDSQRYIPMLSECQYKGSLWEVKTVLPRSEVDDSRPILFRFDQGVRNLGCIMGGKIDNIYDVVDEIAALQSQGRLL